MKYRYIINDLKIFGYHGVHDIEKKDGQFFIINVSFEVTYNNNILKDDIMQVIDYNNICNDISHIFKDRCNLLETLIKKIKDHLESKYKCFVFSIEITKQVDIDQEVKSISVKNI